MSRSRQLPDPQDPVLDRPLDRVPAHHRRKTRRRSPLVLILLLVLWSIILGIGLAQAQTPPAPNPPVPNSSAQAAPAPTSSAIPVTTTDVVGDRFQFGQEIYLENCATCHIALPPAVMPTQTWRDLIQDAQHYGTQITPLVDPARLVVWQYLSVFSRPVLKDEPVPYRLNQSRFLKALHPKVDLPSPVTLNSCATCHPAAAQFNFRSLTPEWENSP